MKRIILILVLFACPFVTGCMGQTNREARVAYVLKNLGVNKDTQQKLKPLLFSYLEEKKKANSQYDGLKDKLRAKIDAETITNQEAEQLLTAKWDAESREFAVKKKYTPKFKTVLSAKKTYKCFDLLNDKKSKVRGTSK